ncbi:MAG: c-type cytochrome [Bauldia sp.]|nr:c-type cytochrome [Bauldia sp.]
MRKRSAFGSGIAAVAVVAALHAAAQSPEPAAEVLTPDAERGQAVAVGASAPDQACMACHGVDGAGDAAAAFPRLAGQSFVYLATTLIDFASGERPHEIMTPIAEALTRQEIIDVAAYYATLTDTPFAPPSAETDAALLQRGGTIAALGLAPAGVQGCINCHGPDGGGLGYEYPAIGGQHAAYLAARLHAFKTAESVGDAQAIMRGIASRLSDEDIAAVAAYYAALRPPPLAQDDIAELPPQLIDAFNDDDGEDAE